MRGHRKILILLTISFINYGCEKNEIPPELKVLRKKNIKVKQYESFSEINPVVPIPAKFDIGIGTIFSAVLFNKLKFKYETISPEKYTDQERWLQKYFIDRLPLQNSLRLLSYARQIQADHPFRINPFVTYFTDRKENSLLANEKPGPAAIVSDLFEQKSPYTGLLRIKDYENNEYSFQVKFSKKSLPRSGSMFLFDSTAFTLKEIIGDSTQNIFENVVFHELTHIWFNELLKKDRRNDSTVFSNKSDNGHDTQIVSNPHLAFGEGLAEAFEALFGTTTSKYEQMSQTERDNFFANITNPQVKGDLTFLLNRQHYIRKNSYLYNLYDFKDCTLRTVSTTSSSDYPESKITEYEKIASLMYSGADLESIVNELAKTDTKNLKDLFDNFSDRFYANSKPISTLTLEENCHYDSPARLEAKEGFVASVIYNLFASGALLEGKELASGDPEMKYSHFGPYLNDSLAEYRQLGIPGRLPASLPLNRVPREELIKRFLASYRNLVRSVIIAQPIEVKELLSYLISSDSFFQPENRIKIAFEILKTTRGLFSMDEELAALSKSRKSILRNKKAIIERLLVLNDRGELNEIIAKFRKAPDIYVEYPSNLRSGNTVRININNAHHIDLIDIFGVNNKEIARQARRLGSGEYFSNESDFLNFAARIDHLSLGEKIIANAKKSLEENEQLREMGTQKQLKSHFLK